MSKLNKQQIKNKPRRKRKPLNFKRIVIIVIFIVYAIVSVCQAVENSEQKSGDITLTQFYDMIDNGEVERINLNKHDNIIHIYSTNGDIYATTNPDSDTFLQEIMERGVDVSVQDKSTTDAIISVLTTLPLTIIMAMFAVYLSSTIVGASTRMFTLIKNENNTTTFDDIKGMDKTKNEVQYIVSQMRNWKKLGELGARNCKGILLYGPPGVGKTLLAKAIANEAGVGFISCCGADFDEVFVGVGASRVRSLFELAAANAPCVVFIDEIETLGRRRRGGDGASQDHNQTLNALLQKMDGLNEMNGILVIGATNMKETLDPAITRPGRFDRHFFVGAPDNKKDRDELVELYLKTKKLDDDVTLEKVSKLMVGLSGAEVEEALNSAVYLSLQRGGKGILRASDIDEAVMQIHTDGVQVEHTTNRDARITAIHEAGHTLAYLLKGIPIAKVSNIPYTSGMGGLTMPDLDIIGENKFKTKTDFDNEIMMYLGGKCAEQIVLGEHTQGCQNDIKVATQKVYMMLSEYAFSDKELANMNALIEMGVSKEIGESLIDRCNIKLSSYNDDTMELLKANKERLLKLSSMILSERTIIQPTLDMIDDYNGELI